MKKLAIPQGTPFQQKVWREIAKVRKGNVVTYQYIAKRIGKPKAVRAVANAVGANPLPIKIPCHRVIRSDGTLGGYSGRGGAATKRKLLKKEGVCF
ncbi:MAG TPA: MGMT family protein [Candidatus Paceibacterota bacterium]